MIRDLTPLESQHLKMRNIWETQKKHVQCIQDPEGVSLYTQTGTCKKEDVVLPK